VASAKEETSGVDGTGRYSITKQISSPLNKDERCVRCG
jgi:hypothetical protein